MMNEAFTERPNSERQSAGFNRAQKLSGEKKLQYLMDNLILPGDALSFLQR
jgi:hypothetical protein